MEEFMRNRFWQLFDELTVAQHLIASLCVSLMIIIFIFLPVRYFKYHEERDVDYTVVDEFYVQDVFHSDAYTWIDDDDDKRYEPESFYVQFYSSNVTFGREDPATYFRFKDRTHTRVKLEVKLRVRETYWKNKLTDSELQWATIAKEL
jgi:hypothetical protein